MGLRDSAFPGGASGREAAAAPWMGSAGPWMGLAGLSTGFSFFNFFIRLTEATAL
jgi:hypothetical protein